MCFCPGHTAGALGKHEADSGGTGELQLSSIWLDVSEPAEKVSCFASSGGFVSASSAALSASDGSFQVVGFRNRFLFQ